MYFYQDRIIQVLNTIGGPLSRIPKRARDIIAWAGCLLLALFFVNEYMADEEKLVTLCSGCKDMFCYGILLLITLMCINGKLGRVQWSIPVICAGGLLAAWILIAAAVHPVGEGFVPLAFALLVLLPVMSVVFGSQGNYSSLFEKIAGSFCLVDIVVLIVSLRFVTGEMVMQQALRFSGMVGNPNKMGMLCLTGIVAGLYLLGGIHGRKGKRLLQAGIGFASVVLSVIMLMRCDSRTALIAAVFVGIVFLGTRRFWLDYMSRNRKKALAGVLAAFLAVVLFSVLITAARLPELFSADYLEIVEETGQVPAVINYLSSGRAALYSAVIKGLNLMGHNMSGGVFDLGAGSQYIGAHNTVLDFGYRCGIPAGLAMLAIKIIALMFVIRRLVGAPRHKGFELLPILAIVAFLFESLLEIQVLPSDRDITFLFFIAMIAVLNAPQTENNGEE